MGRVRLSRPVRTESGEADLVAAPRFSARGRVQKRPHMGTFGIMQVPCPAPSVT